MKSVYLYLLGLVLVMACHQGKSDKSVSHQKSESAVEKSVEPQTATFQTGQSIIEGAIGIVTVTENVAEKDTVRVFNEDGSLWYKFSFFYNDNDGKFDFPNDNFKPLAFHPDYFLLRLKATDNSGDRYEVIVNEATGLKKYLEKNKKFLLFQTWEEHIMSVFAVGFNDSSNPLLENPSEMANRAYYDQNEFYHPNRIKGEWLQVKWGSKGDWKYGWIRWKEKEKLLIELFYFA